MSITYAKITINKEVEGVTYKCDFCGKEEGPFVVDLVWEEKSLKSWIRITPMIYGTNEKYYLSLCDSCAKKHNLLVGQNHPDWNRKEKEE